MTDADDARRYRALRDRVPTNQRGWQGVCVTSVERTKQGRWWSKLYIGDDLDAAVDAMLGSDSDGGTKK